MSTAMSISWTEDLIDLVLQQPALIDPSHQDYRNISKRDRIWDSLAEKLGTSGEDVKKKWRSLRDTYGRFVKRQRLFSGPGKLKKWLWADKMEPLRMHLTACNGSDSPDPSMDTDGEYLLDNTNDTGYFKTDGDQSTKKFEATSSENVVFDPTVPEVMLTSTSSPMTGLKRRFTEKPPGGNSVDWGYFEDDKRSRMDPTDLLFLAHAGTIKTFSGKRQAITKLKIAQIIMEQELLHEEELAEFST
uniref:Transcription factor Adf-1 n=2 Tax=Lygus hesperus TaxID=30085 RepID=A0A0A9ZCL6_LYGHE